MKRCLAVIGLFLLLVAPAAPVAAAAKAKPADSKKSTAASGNDSLNDSVTHSYNADKGVQIGMLVSLKATDANTIVPFSGSGIKNLLGVVVPNDSATITLTPTTTKQQQVLVASSGRVNLLVSTQNGPIKVGDYVSPSAINGIAMKASVTDEGIVGKAAGNFTGTANVISSVDLQDTMGHKSKAAIGRLPLDISVAHNPLLQKASDNVPGFLNQVATTVASKPVSAARIYLSLVVFLITAIVTGNLLYSGVRSGMIAVGRNPLSKKSIIRSLIQTVIAGLIIFIAGVFAVYLLLKL